MKSFILIIVILAGFINISFAEDICLGCHKKDTPGIVAIYNQSAHFRVNVSCTDCHGTDIEANHKRQSIAGPKRCAPCHKKAFEEHSKSRHGIGLKSGRGCTRQMEKTADIQRSCSFCHIEGALEPISVASCAMYLAQTDEMRRRGCESCHMVEARCDTCHTKHLTDISIAKSPDTCGVCHMGPDHPQYEMWTTSQHGALYKQNQHGLGPSCVTCHLSGGSHDVSRGIASGIPESKKELRDKERGFMIDICSSCHTKSLAGASLNDADIIERQGRILVNEARGIIEGLQKDGLLSPAPSKRPPHPLEADRFTLGSHMLYEDLSTVESLYFKMSRFYYITSYKGAFHQNPDYAHWYGNAPMKLTLSEIKSQAALLREAAILKKRIDNLGPSIDKDYTKAPIEDLKTRLRRLNEKRLREEITEEQYQKERSNVLDEGGF